MDLTSPGRNLPDPYKQPRNGVKIFKPIVAALFSLPMPTIAVVTGHASTVGFAFALSHDYIIMSRDRVGHWANASRLFQGKDQIA
ncbi:Crotonase superfamily [Corchorus capsularis]|uniref:Crotonase superfamily n=1 Tax=Corchorus capsularis TaxID=210143 RepID=A0A1R3JRS9_COCAP|nr:Crotonase superfamily [Corchorus capsularis]